MILALAATALLSFTDPQSDAYGDGSLKTPTAAVNRTIGALDLTQLEVYKTASFSFSLSFASLTNPFNLPNGFSFPIIEVYIADPEQLGSTTLLPGSDMTLPKGASWKYAFKLSGDHVQVFEATSQGIEDIKGIEDISSKNPAKLSITGNTLIVQTSLPRPEKFDLYTMVGNYSPFSETGWMPTSSSSSSWAYFSETQTSPVVDILASSQEKQKIAIQTGVLPPLETPNGANPWFYVMFGGIILAGLGLISRFFVKPMPVVTQTPEPLNIWVEPEDTLVITPAAYMAAERTKSDAVLEEISRDIDENPENLNEPLSENLNEPLSENLSENLEETHQDLHNAYLDPEPTALTQIASDPRLENSAPAETLLSPPLLSETLPPKPINVSTPNLFNVWIDDEANDTFDWSLPSKKVNDSSPKNDSD